MPQKIAIFVAIFVVAVGYFLYTSFIPQSKTITEVIKNGIQSPSDTDQEPIKTLAQKLDTPWDLVFLPDWGILFTSRSGKLSLLNKDLFIEDIATIDEVTESGEGGLLGIELHPNFAKNKFIYLYYTSSNKNNIVRYILDNKKLTQDKIILSNIPGNSNHDGGRIRFGPDGKLYATTGDSQVENLSQDTNSLAGKILRLNDDGSIPQDNPIPGSLVYSYGHRNPQGLAWDSQGRLWETEHGSTSYDEVNLISPNKNYGWPTVRGDKSQTGMEIPFLHSSNQTWAPSGAEVFEDSLYFTGLRGGAIYKLKLDKSKPLQEFFKNQFGRIRTIKLGPDGNFYILTNNRDGRGKPIEEDDRIIKIHPSLLE